MSSVLLGSTSKNYKYIIFIINGISILVVKRKKRVKNCKAEFKPYKACFNSFMTQGEGCHLNDRVTIQRWVAFQERPTASIR